MAQNITVTATSVNYDVADTIVLILLSGVFQTSFFQGSIGILNATTGCAFDYKIDRSFFTTSDLHVSVDPGAAASWLSFDPADFEFHGQVPSDLQPEMVILNITASERMQSQSQVFMIAIPRGDKEKTQAMGGSINSTIHGQAPPTAAGSRMRWLPAAVLVPITVVLRPLLMAFLYITKGKPGRSRRRNQPKKKISRPIMQESSWVTVSEGEMAGPIDRDPKR